jgi:hypothetical protein
VLSDTSIGLDFERRSPCLGFWFGRDIRSGEPPIRVRDV